MRRSWMAAAAAILVVAAVGCSDPEAEKQQYFESGNRYFEQQKYAEAIVEYRNAIRIDDRFAAARAKLGDAYAATGDMRRAFREYVRAADLLPDDNEAQLKAATALSLTGQFEDAKTRVERVLQRDAQNVQAQILLGNILAGLKDINGAIEQIEEAIQIDPARGASYTNLGALRLAQGERDAARAAFAKAIEVDPKSVSPRLAMALFLLQVGEAAEAEKALQAALALEPRHPTANRAMAALYLASNRAAEAEPYLKAFAEATNSPQASYVLADYYALIGREADAKGVLSPLTSQEATAAEAEWRLARIEYRSDRAAAHERVDRLLANNGQNVAALLLKSRWLLGEGKREDALTHVQRAIKAQPDNPTAHYIEGTIHAVMQDKPAAVRAFNEVLRLNPRVAAAQLQLSRLQLAEGATAEAVQLAESALKNAPDNPEAQLTLATGLIAQRDFTRADPIVGDLLKRYPNLAPVAALDGMRQLAKKNPTAARAAYERALQLDQRSFPAVAGLTALDMLERKPDAALARIERQLSIMPDHPQLLLLASRVYLTTNRHGDAERLLRRMIQIAPAATEAYSLLGQLYVAQKRLPEARAEFDAAAARNPKDVASRTVAAMLSHQGNEIEDAKKRYREIVDRYPEAAVAANNLAWILAEEGKDLDEALRLAQRAIQLAPERAEIQDTLGWVYYLKELPALAIPPFQKSVAAAPDNATYHYHLGLALAKNGNVEEARRALDTALKLNPNYAEARQFMASLRE